MSGATPGFGAALAALARGGVIVYPTETFYGLGAAALHAAPVRAAAALKGRDATKPIAVLVADRAMLGAIVARVPRPAAVLMERFWPGPLTLVLPARAGLPPELTAGSGRIGVRISSHATAQALVAALGEPITTTSANAAGDAAPVDVAAAVAAFGPRVDAYLDGGLLAGGPASTVLVVDDDMARVVRAGAVAIETLRDALGATPIHPPD